MMDIFPAGFFPAIFSNVLFRKRLLFQFSKLGQTLTDLYFPFNREEQPQTTKELATYQGSKGACVCISRAMKLFTFNKVFQHYQIQGHQSKVQIHTQYTLFVCFSWLLHSAKKLEFCSALTQHGRFTTIPNENIILVTFSKISPMYVFKFILLRPGLGIIIK